MQALQLQLDIRPIVVDLFLALDWFLRLRRSFKWRSGGVVSNTRPLCAHLRRLVKHLRSLPDRQSSFGAMRG